MSEYIYGRHAAKALISHQPESIQAIYLSKSDSKRLADIKQLAMKRGLTTETVHANKLDELAGSNNHQGIVLQVEPFNLRSEHDLAKALENLPEQAAFLLLDTIQDPHNVGACIRTAEAFGLEGVIFSSAKSAKITASVRKVACGAEMAIPIYQVANLSRSIELLKQAGVWVYGTTLDTDISLDKAKLKGKVAIVMGNEESGLRELTQKKCDGLISIPLSGMTESLNVSVATGICLYELSRQRLD